MPHPKRLTPSERYLLHVIAHLRGSATDAWARLNYIAVRRSESLDEAMKIHASPDELDEGEKELHLKGLGAGLPYPRYAKHITAKEYNKLLTEFRTRVRRGFEATREEPNLSKKTAGR